MKNSRVTCSNKLYLFHIYVNPINPYPANEPLLQTKTTEYKTEITSTRYYVKSNLFARLKAKVKNLKKESQNIIEASKKKWANIDLVFIFHWDHVSRINSSSQHTFPLFTSATQRHKILVKLFSTFHFPPLIFLKRHKRILYHFFLFAGNSNFIKVMMKKSRLLPPLLHLHRWMTCQWTASNFSNKGHSLFPTWRI